MRDLNITQIDKTTAQYDQLRCAILATGDPNLYPIADLTDKDLSRLINLIKSKGDNLR